MPLKEDAGVYLHQENQGKSPERQHQAADGLALQSADRQAKVQRAIRFYNVKQWWSVPLGKFLATLTPRPRLL